VIDFDPRVKDSNLSGKTGGDYKPYSAENSSVKLDSNKADKV